METLAIEVSVTRLVKFDGEGSLKAFCEVALGNQFLIKGLRVVQGKNGLFVSMPRQQGKDNHWYNSVEALTKEAKAEVGRIVLEAYEQQTASFEANR